MSIRNKRLQVFQSIHNTAQAVNKAIMDFENAKPKKKLKGRLYRKQRRWERYRRKRLAVGIAMSTAIGLLQTQLIISTSIPKFNKGG